MLEGGKAECFSRKIMRITITGAGYVGLSTAVCLAKYHDVVALDVSESRVDSINKKISPIHEILLTRKLKEVNLRATTDVDEAYKDTELIIIAVPTNYDERIGKFDLSILDNALEKAAKTDAVIVIKSTIPVGYTEEQIKKYGDRVLFSPEFMREGRSYHDVTNPSRIIAGCGKTEDARKYASEYVNIMKNASLNNPPVMIMGTSEAESVKLYSNCYLAMRVAFFNELDTYAYIHGLDTKNIIEGVMLDPRIGEGYANPSFGFGGYCLPKDTRQLAAQMGKTPGSLIRAIPDSNDIRIKFIVQEMLKHKGTIGIYGVGMKAGSDNARASSVIRVANDLIRRGRDVIVYDKNIKIDVIPQVGTVDELYEKADVILANRKPVGDDYIKLKDKLYTRDIFGNG